MQSSVPVKRSGLLSVAAEQAAGEVGIADREGRRVRRRNCARLAWVVCAIGLGGCAQQPVPTSPAKPPINLSGYSPAFKEGFAAGCDTAKGQRRRDERRFNDEAQYARGWEDGRSICTKR